MAPMAELGFDVVVVGAGIAGAACAAFLAEGGRRVALVDRRSPERAGAHWVNGVPARAFDDARVERPRPPAELRGQGHGFVVTSPSGRARVRLVAKNPVLEVDMRHLGARLRDRAKAAGATVLTGTTVARVETREVLAGARRPIALETDDGDVLRAPLFVDASGLPSVIRRAAFPSWPDVSRDDLCLAAQYVHRIVDDVAAARFLERHGLRDGEVLARTGTRGGYSVLNLRVQQAEREVAILAGAIPGAGTTGAIMLDELLAEEPWIGPRVFGGAGAIPLRRPYARLVAPGLALLSGIAIGLRAARMLSDAVLADGPERAGEPAVLWAYARAFHVRHGANLCGYDAVRRMAQGLSPSESEQLFAADLVTTSTVHAALAQELPPLRLRELARTARGALRAPRLAAKMARVVARIPLLRANAMTYPRSPNLRALAAYERRTARILGDAIDPVD
jgi:flavin-dependent dehydrogenase